MTFTGLGLRLNLELDVEQRIIHIIDGCVGGGSGGVAVVATATGDGDNLRGRA